MTYTKKKIVVEADVPDGATHYEAWQGGIGWYMLKDTVWSWFEDDTWFGFAGYAPDNAQPIEVIE